MSRAYRPAGIFVLSLWNVVDVFSLEVLCQHCHFVCQHCATSREHEVCLLLITSLSFSVSVSYE